MRQCAACDVAAASDMLRQAETRGEPSSRLAGLSVVMRKVSPNWMLVYLCKNPNGFLAQCAAPFGKTVRRLVRREVVEVLTGIQCFLVAHKEAQEHTRAVLVAHGSQDGFLDEVNKVCSESDKSMKMAEMYLARLNSLELAGETILQLREGLRARRTALELCDRMMKHIHHEAHEGASRSPRLAPWHIAQRAPRPNICRAASAGPSQALSIRARKPSCCTSSGTTRINSARASRLPPTAPAAKTRRPSAWRRPADSCASHAFALGRGTPAFSALLRAALFPRTQMQGFMKVHMQMQRKIDDFNDYGALKAKPFTFHKVHGTMADLKVGARLRSLPRHALCLWFSQSACVRVDQAPRSLPCPLTVMAGSTKEGG